MYQHASRGNNGGSGQGGATHENRGSISGIRVSLFPSKDHSEGYGMTVSMVDVPYFMELTKEDVEQERKLTLIFRTHCKR